MPHVPIVSFYVPNTSPLVDFLVPPGTEWDAPLVGAPFETPPVPPAEIFDLRVREEITSRFWASRCPVGKARRRRCSPDYFEKEQRSQPGRIGVQKWEVISETWVIRQGWAEAGENP